MRARIATWVMAPAASALAIGVVSVSNTAPASATTRHTVRIQANDFYFCSIKKSSCSSSDSGHVTKIVKGTKVVWIYKDHRCSTIPLCPGHDVKVGKRKVSPTVRSQGKVIKSMIFKSVGTFHYVCTHHKSMGMTGVIKVHRRRA
jgi:hypothetical protein